MFYPYTFGYGFFELAVALLAVGSIITVVSFLAFCGVLMESRRITYAYIFIITIVILLEGGIIMYCFLQQKNLAKISKDIWDSCDHIIKSALQTNNECCGYESVSDSQYCSFLSSTCKDKIIDILSENYTLISFIMIGITVFELINLTLAIFLRRYYIKTEFDQYPQHELVMVNEGDMDEKDDESAYEYKGSDDHNNNGKIKPSNNFQRSKTGAVVDAIQ